MDKDDKIKLGLALSAAAAAAVIGYLYVKEEGSFEWIENPTMADPTSRKLTVRAISDLNQMPVILDAVNSDREAVQIRFPVLKEETKDLLRAMEAGKTYEITNHFGDLSCKEIAEGPYKPKGPITPKTPKP